MPIISVAANGSCTVKCSKCDTVASFGPTDLVLGSGPPDIPQPDPNVIVLPMCACGRRESLNRTFDTMPTTLIGSAPDLVRRMVNRLSVILKANSRSHVYVAAIHAAETTTPPDIVPPEGFSIS